MRTYFIGALIVGLLFVCGCTNPAAPPVTPVPTTEPATPVPTETPAPTPTPEPYEDALVMGGAFQYGTEEDKREITIYRAFTVPTYWWHSTDTGSNWETQPQDAENNQFLFVSLKVRHLGTKKEIGAPHPTGISVFFDGTLYPSWSGRDNDSPPIVDLGLPIDDYYGGILRQYETRDGFIIFEVPKTLTPGAAYLLINLGNQYEAPVWRLG